jgi:hypothetical protein
LVGLGFDCLLEGLPTGMSVGSEVLAVLIALEVLDFPLKAKWFCVFWSVLGGSLNPVGELLLLLLKVFLVLS